MKNPKLTTPNLQQLLHTTSPQTTTSKLQEILESLKTYEEEKRGAPASQLILKEAKASQQEFHSTRSLTRRALFLLFYFAIALNIELLLSVFIAQGTHTWPIIWTLLGFFSTLIGWVLFERDNASLILGNTRVESDFYRAWGFDADYTRSYTIKVSVEKVEEKNCQENADSPLPQNPIIDVWLGHDVPRMPDGDDVDDMKLEELSAFFKGGHSALRLRFDHFEPQKLWHCQFSAIEKTSQVVVSQKIMIPRGDYWFGCVNRSDYDVDVNISIQPTLSSPSSWVFPLED